jgi:hypothetical protein
MQPDWIKSSLDKSTVLSAMKIIGYAVALSNTGKLPKSVIGWTLHVSATYSRSFAP